MSSCGKCGKNLGLLASKHKSEDGMIICDSCFITWKNEQDKNKQKVMEDFLSKYIADKNEIFRARIIWLNQNKHADIKEHWDDYSLNRLRGFYQNMLNSAEYQKRGRLSSYEMDERIDTKDVAEGVLEFLDDLEKFFKLFEKKDMVTNYSEILSCLSNIIEDEMNKNMEKEIVNPAYKRISKKLGEGANAESVLREFMKIPLDIDYIEDINSPFSFICRLLDKFNFRYNREEIEQIINKIQEEADLEDFEQNLGSQKKSIALEDFATLNGYEFEAYLNNLFSQLGYTVMETSLSGDQGADLVLSKDGEKTVVQAKKYNNPVPNKAIQEIAAARNHYNANKAMVVTNSSFTSSAVELALSNNVELWDGEKLNDIVKGLNTTKKGGDLSYKKTYKLEEGKNLQKFQSLCPFCEESFEFEFDPSEGIKTMKMDCPNCGASITADIDYGKSWKCEYCSESFPTYEEAVKHEETCDLRK